ncbi:unnamed protein product, partial [Mesorhabditis belari]|uniref:Elongation of very long chain fatty acids protein n=1 Tax=Mesorhabditis belari TaxID=2138241 RepID=A0AAF3FFA2_9BILA
MIASEVLHDFWSSLNDFSLYKTNHTDHGIHSNYRYSFALPFERVDEPVLITKFLQQNWAHTITISVIYFAIIKLIQSYLEHKKAFDLRLPLIFWNAFLALFSIFGFIRFGEDLFYSLQHRTPYEWICYSCHPNDVAAFWSLLFAISKIFELGDTLFIVLRKNRLYFCITTIMRLFSFTQFTQEPSIQLPGELS